jgi:L-tyrosine isonitrile synthase
MTSPTVVSRSEATSTCPMEIQSARDVAQRILELVFAHRRLLPDQACANTCCEQCYAPHIGKVVLAIERREPVHFVLPAFPAKSANRNKTLGPDPDLAEELALRLLQRICEQIKALHSPGAHVSLCSDGRVFGDLVQVSDANVTLYREGIRELCREINANSLDQFTLDDAFDLRDFGAMREELLIQHAVALSTVRQEVRDAPAARQMFDGIHRFVFEDYCALFPERSRNQLRQSTKSIAYRVIQRSNAWSRAIAARFPDAVRLSIHPQPAHSDKLGIAFMTSTNVWRTPWHGVVLDRGTEMVLVQCAEAKGLGATLITRKGRPSHYELRETPNNWAIGA